VVSADPRPSYEDVVAANAELRAVLGQLRTEVAALRAENAELKRQLGMNSQNSSKPPSSDSPFDKPAPKSLRRKSGRKPGGQPGHRGATPTLVDDPDETRRHEPGACGGCGVGLAGAEQVGVERRQVFDLPPLRVQVIEHQLVKRRCGCGALGCGAAPEGVNAAVAIWAAGHSGHPVLVCGAVPVQTTHCASFVGAVRHPGVTGHGIGDDPARLRRP